MPVEVTSVGLKASYLKFLGISKSLKLFEDVLGWVEGGYDASPLPVRSVRARFRAYGSRRS